MPRFICFTCGSVKEVDTVETTSVYGLCAACVLKAKSRDVGRTKNENEEGKALNLVKGEGI